MEALGNRWKRYGTYESAMGPMEVLWKRYETGVGRLWKRYGTAREAMERLWKLWNG